MKKNNITFYKIVVNLFFAVVASVAFLGNYSVVVADANVPNHQFGEDDRVRVENSLAFPYQAIVRVSATFEKADSNGYRTFYGTGAMISPNKVLTVAHNVYWPDKGWAQTITVAPAQNGINNLPFGEYNVTEYQIIDDNYISAAHGNGDFTKYDVAVLTLDKNMGDLTAYFGLTTTFDQDTVYHSAGYPYVFGGYDMYRTSSKVLTDSSQDPILTYMDTAGGQSGSPVFNNKNEIIGIVSGEQNLAYANGGVATYPNSVTRLNQKHINKINQYIKSGSQEEKGQPLYRLYNPNIGLHFYTQSLDEHNSLVKLGWKSEGIAWHSPVTGAPVYRLYNPNQGTHHFTTNASEKDHLVTVGWRYEGVAFYSGGNLNVYRMYNPNSGEHFYTLNSHEREMLVKVGWTYEGIGFKAKNR